MRARFIILLVACMADAARCLRSAWTRRAIASAALSPAVAGWSPAAFADAAPLLQAVRGSGFAFSVPPSYYRPKSRASTGTADDTIFTAADFAAGRTASISKTGVATLLLESGDPLPLTAGAIRSLQDIGRPKFVASLLVGRRDNDALGRQTSRSEIRDVVREGNELRFTVLTLAPTATTMTTVKPGVRRTIARTLFVPPPPGSEIGPYLLTAWASSAVDPASATCEIIPCEGRNACGEGRSLRCECPPPKCVVSSDLAPDALDSTIVSSLALI